ncbi:MAG: hypothetical protein AB7O97_06045 [Planctomycetota bacterium]
MNKALKTSLRRYLGLAGGPALGDAAEAGTRRRLSLRYDLELLRRQNHRWLWFHGVALALVFAVFLIAVLTRLADPPWIAAFLGASGLSAAWCIARMRLLWRDKWLVDLLLLSLDDLSQQALDDLALTLLRALVDGKPATTHAIGPPVPQR